MNLERATEVFIHGFAFTRSFTHPYLAEQLQPGVWVLRDAPRARGDYRGEEYVAYDSSPTALDAPPAAASKSACCKTLPRRTPRFERRSGSLAIA
jgi:hypothetical protein